MNERTLSERGLEKVRCAQYYWKNDDSGKVFTHEIKSGKIFAVHEDMIVRYFYKIKLKKLFA